MINKLIDTLYRTDVQLPKQRSFYDQVIEKVETDYLAPQVHYLLKRRGLLERTPLFFQVRLKQQYQEVICQNFLIKSQTEEMLNKLEAACLAAIPIKGVYFSEKYFGHLGARSTSDIDLLIKEKDLSRVIAIVKNMGFKVEEEPIPGHFHCSFSKLIPGSPVPLTAEIHWNLLRESTSNLKMNAFWDEAVSLEGYQFIKMLSDYHTFYAICLHGWRHNLDSPKHFLDIIQLIVRLKDQLDYNRLLKDARTDQTRKRLKRTLWMVYQQYPWLNDIKPLPYQKSGREKFNKYVRFMDYQFLSYDSIGHSLIEVFHWLLPNRFELSAELGRGDRRAVYFYQLVTLYKKRGANFLRAMINH